MTGHDHRGDKNPRWNGGATSHELYNIYMEMIARCERESHIRYGDYGGRGISVSSEWRRDFWKFVSDIGERPPGKGKGGRSIYSIDRINNDENYEPGNVRWATHAQQLANRRKGYRGVRQKGEDNNASILTDQKVNEMRRRKAAGDSTHEIAKSFNVSRTTVWSVVTRRSWVHVP